jgi:hypothetical protein
MILVLRGRGWSAGCVWNVVARARKTDFVFRRNGRVHLNRQGRQFSRLLAAEVCASAVVMLDTPCSKVVWRVLATHSIRQFPLHFPSRASPCAIKFQKHYTTAMRTLNIVFVMWLESLYPIISASSKSLQSVEDLGFQYRGAGKSLARPGRKQPTVIEDFEFHTSYL